MARSYPAPGAENCGVGGGELSASQYSLHPAERAQAEQLLRRLADVIEEL